MKIHFYVTGFRNATMDLDKKLPYLIKTYPDTKIEKSTQYNFPCIKGTNIVKNTHIVKLFDKTIEEKINIDFYGFSHMCLSYFDISFDVDQSFAETIMQKERVINKTVVVDSNVIIDGKSHSFAMLITQFILPYYDVENSLKIEKSLDDNVSALNKNLDVMVEKTAMRPYCSNGMMSGLSVSLDDNYVMIEDYDDEFDTSNDSWENIMVDDISIYLNKTKSILVCKNKRYYDDCCIYHMSCKVTPSMFKYARDASRDFLYTIKKLGQDIRKNIIDNNHNLYYWKELKKTIEVIDLNFLEFHVDMINMSKIDFDDLFSNWNATEISDKHRNECENYMIRIIKNLHADLNEVKYVIKNISTPSHTHDEDTLQKETEKVNDRILMLSFIAMAVSAIGMMQSDEIDVGLKIMSGAAIFSLPILYYLARGVQKKISLRKNKRNELTRQLDNSIKALEQAKKEYDNVKNEKDLPEDFKAGLVKFMKQFITAAEGRVVKIKKKIK